MTKIRVTKQFNFEASHALWNYDGKCKNIHGHTYKLFVTVIGVPISDVKNHQQGMVIDFGDLKKIVNTEIVNKFDHSLIVSKYSNKIIRTGTEQMFERYIETENQPTCENMVILFSEILKNKLPEKVELFSIRLYETENSFAEWFASDN